MTDTSTTPDAASAKSEDPIAALEARITELENIVHTLPQYIPVGSHSKFIAWAERVAERIKAAL
jgi:hypothetical protein